MTDKIKKELKEILKSQPVATIRLALSGYDETIKNCFESVAAELKQLKTLDDNVKRKIDAAKNSTCFGWVFDKDEYLEFLESLYKKQD